MKKFLISLFLLTYCIIPCFADEENPFIEEETKKEVFESKVNEVYDKTEVVKYKTYKISAIDKAINSKNNNKLVIYTPLYGKRTNTDLKGIEAVVVNNRVVKINRSDSYIPANGYVISAHGKAKKFITDNCFEGADVDVDFDKGLLKIVSHPDNYVYIANFRLNKAKAVLKTKDPKSPIASDMEFYINLSENILNRTKKLVEFKDFEGADVMAEDSMIYSDKALFVSIPFNPADYRAIWIFPYQKNKDEVAQVFDIVERLNFDNIYIEVYFNGSTIYESEVQQKYGLPSQNRSYREFDPIAAWIEIAKMYNKNVYVTFNAFNLGNIPKSTLATSIVKIHPDWISKSSNKTNYYLNPENPEVQNYLLELIKEVQTKYDIKGINITGLDIKDNVDLSGFLNKVANINAKKVTAISIPYGFKNLEKITSSENIIILPLFTSSDDDFARDFINSIQNAKITNKICPVYYTPYLEEPPRKLFDQVMASRSMHVNGLMLYHLDYLTKDYYDAFLMRYLKKPSTKKQDHLYDKGAMQ